GLVSYSPAICLGKDVEAVKRMAVNLVRGAKTFCIDASRCDKSFPLTSPEINILVGDYVVEHTGTKVQLKQPEAHVRIEIHPEQMYVYSEVVSCFGGLPVGSGGKVLLLLENEQSILAGLLCMKRGISIIPVSVRRERDISLLQSFAPFPLRQIVAEQMVDIEPLAQKHRCLSVISGQTLQEYSYYDVPVTVFRPVIAYTSSQIEEGLQAFLRASLPHTLNTL
ncbi:MAG: THUMP domain-containing protein, partial [Nanoarchaeota archaeon]